MVPVTHLLVAGRYISSEGGRGGRKGREGREEGGEGRGREGRRKGREEGGRGREEKGKGVSCHPKSTNFDKFFWSDKLASKFSNSSTTAGFVWQRVN